MIRRFTLATLIILSGTCSPLWAIVIDEFDTAPFVLNGNFNGADIVEQNGVDAEKVPFGSRYAHMRNTKGTFEPGTVRLGIDAPANAFFFEATGLARASQLHWSYGDPLYDYSNPANDVDFLVDGSYALRLRFAFADFGPTSDSSRMLITVSSGQPSGVSQSLWVVITESSEPFDLVAPLNGFGNAPDFSAVNGLSFYLGSPPLEAEFVIERIDTLAIPEPTTATLLILGVMGGGMRPQR